MPCRCRHAYFRLLRVDADCHLRAMPMPPLRQAAAAAFAAADY